MAERFVDYRYALDLAKRINSVVESSPAIQSSLLYREFDLWQGYQATLFADIKIWSESRRISWSSRNAFESLKLMLTALVCILLSLLGAVWLILSRRKILVFTGDRVEGKYKNDVRLGHLYQVLHEDALPYLEVVHTIVGRGTFKKFLKRGRWVIYLEAFDFLFLPLMWLEKAKARKSANFFSFNDFNESEKKLARFELEKFIFSRKMMIFRMYALQGLLKLSGVKKMFTIDDVRHYNEFVAAGKLASLPVVAIQHGHFTKYHTGWLKMTNLKAQIIKPDFLIVWSTYWKEELLRLRAVFAASEIIIGRRGEDRHSDPASLTRGKITLLVPYERDASKLEVRNFIMNLLRNNIEVIFKLRVDEDKSQQLEEYGLDESMSKLRIATSLDNILPEITAAVGTYSTLLYEMVEKGKPVAILETKIDYGEGMVRNGLASLIGKEADFTEAVRKLSTLSKAEINQRRRRLLGGESKEMVAVIRSIIREHASN